MPRKRGEGTYRKRPDGRWEARLSLRDPITGLPRRLSIYRSTQRELVDEVRAIQMALDHGCCPLAQEND